MSNAFDSLLTTSRLGDPGAAQQLFGQVYDELRRQAHRQLRGRSPQDGLSTTGLVHEAFVKLFHGRPPNVKDRAHFMAVAARAMRLVLVDAARERLADKRGGGWRRVELGETLSAGGTPTAFAADVLALHAALEGLARLDERLAQVVELRFFGGMTEEEVALELGLTARTVRRDWRAARALLLVELDSAPRQPAAPPVP